MISLAEDADLTVGWEVVGGGSSLLLLGFWPDSRFLDFVKKVICFVAAPPLCAGGEGEEGVEDGEFKVSCVPIFFQG